MSDQKEKTAQALGMPNTVSQKVSDGIIAQPNTASQAVKKKTGSKRFAHTKVLSLYAKVYSGAIKCYEEQLPNGLQFTLDAIRNYNAHGNSGLQILAIVHDRDEVTDGIWEVPKLGKWHLHVIFRAVNSTYRIRVYQLLNSLGIVFRKGVDDSLIENHGLETVGNFSGYALYLTHETADSIAAGKEFYRFDEIVSNLTDDEVEQIRNGYIRTSPNAKLSVKELITLDDEAYQLGQNLGNFQLWYDRQPFAVRSHAKMRVIRESYMRGVEARVLNDNQVLRLCVFIQGSGNIGKTYAAHAALKAIGARSIMHIGGGGSGKFDTLRPDIDAIIVDDDKVPNLLNVCDNYMCHVYKRNSNNPVWAGRYLIITSNLPFEDWVAQKCGVPTVRYSKSAGAVVPSEEFEAIQTRFFVCEVYGVKNPQEGGKAYNQLGYPHSVSNRGSVEEQKKRIDLFHEFAKSFNETIVSYQPRKSGFNAEQYEMDNSRDGCLFAFDTTNADPLYRNVKRNKRKK